MDEEKEERLDGRKERKMYVDDSPLVLKTLVLLAGEVTTDDGLQPGDDLSQAVVTDFFKLTQDTSTEEDLIFLFIAKLNFRPTTLPAPNLSKREEEY